jgi:hypothetical protein
VSYPHGIADVRRGLLPRVFTLAACAAVILCYDGRKVTPTCAFRSGMPCPVRTFLPFGRQIAPPLFHGAKIIHFLRILPTPFGAGPSRSRGHGRPRVGCGSSLRAKPGVAGCGRVRPEMESPPEGFSRQGSFRGSSLRAKPGVAGCGRKWSRPRKAFPDRVLFSFQGATAVSGRVPGRVSGRVSGRREAYSTWKSRAFKSSSRDEEP